MKVAVFNLDGEKVKEIELPKFFESRVRIDLINRAFLAIRSQKYQPKGKSPSGGKKHVVESPGKGYDISRVSRTGGGFGIARFVALAVGGRRVRAPKSNKIIVERINKKEKFRAFLSALAAISDPILVQMRGHKVDGIKQVPVIVTDDFENLEKTKEVRETLYKLGFKADLDRVSSGRRVRAGKGKRRGRKYKRRKGPLIIVSGENEKIIRAARNLEGVDVVSADYVSVEHLAPGGHPGRLTIITESALKKLEERIINRAKKLRLSYICE